MVYQKVAGLRNLFFWYTLSFKAYVYTEKNVFASQDIPW